MGRIFAGLGTLGATLLAATLVLGYASGVRPDLRAWHLGLGVLSAVYLCALHTIVMFHFIGTGADLKEKAALLGGDDDLVRRTRRFKAVVFPLATFSMLAVILGEMLGGGAHVRAFPAWVHWVSAWAAVALNAVTLEVERRALVENTALGEATNRRLAELVTPGFLREGAKP